MKDKRGLQLAISTLVVLVLSMLVLIVLITGFTMGWSNFWERLSGFFGSDVDNVSKLCQTQCDLQSEFSFCCVEKELGREVITCLDSRLNVDCSMVMGKKFKLLVQLFGYN